LDSLVQVRCAEYFTVPTLTIARGYGTVDQLKAEVDIARSLLGVTSESILPIGIGYLCFRLELPGVQAFDYLDVALDSKVKAVWLSFGERIADWIAYIREKESTPGATKIFVQISTVEEALTAMKDWKVDVVSAQGLPSLSCSHPIAESSMTANQAWKLEDMVWVQHLP